jgi:hypothetical protein
MKVNTSIVFENGSKVEVICYPRAIELICPSELVIPYDELGEFMDHLSKFKPTNGKMKRTRPSHIVTKDTPLIMKGPKGNPFSEGCLLHTVLNSTKKVWKKGQTKGELEAAVTKATHLHDQRVRCTLSTLIHKYKYLVPQGGPNV